MANKMLAVDCTLFWTNPNRPDKYGKVSGTFGLLAPDAIEAIKAAGLKVKFDADNDVNSPEHLGFYIKARSDTAVPCKDSEGNTLPSTLLLGNGTKATVILESRNWVSSEHGTSGVKAMFRALKVRELVPYDPDAAAKSKAETMLDGIPGGGFVFGGAQEAEEDGMVSDETTATADDEEFNRLFGTDD